MSLFPDIDVAGHGARNGLDPDGGALQKVIAKNMFQESDRGAPFRRKLAFESRLHRDSRRFPAYK